MSTVTSCKFASVGRENSFSLAPSPFLAIGKSFMGQRRALFRHVKGGVERCSKVGPHFGTWTKYRRRRPKTTTPSSSGRGRLAAAHTGMACWQMARRPYRTRLSPGFPLHAPRSRADCRMPLSRHGQPPPKRRHVMEWVKRHVHRRVSDRETTRKPPA